MQQRQLAYDLFTPRAMFADNRRSTSGDLLYVNWQTGEIIVNTPELYSREEWLVYDPVLTDVLEFLRSFESDARYTARALLTAMLDPAVQMEYSFTARDVRGLTPPNATQEWKKRYTEANLLARVVHELAVKQAPLVDTSPTPVSESIQWAVDYILAGITGANASARKQVLKNNFLTLHWLSETDRVNVLRAVASKMGVRSGDTQKLLEWHMSGRLTQYDAEEFAGNSALRSKGGHLWEYEIETMNKWAEFRYNEVSVANMAQRYHWLELNPERAEDNEDFAVLSATPEYIAESGWLSDRYLETYRFSIQYNGRLTHLAVVIHQDNITVWHERYLGAALGVLPLVAACGRCDRLYAYEDGQFRELTTQDGTCPHCREQPLTVSPLVPWRCMYP
jgi:hypothetical protein